MLVYLNCGRDSWPRRTVPSGPVPDEDPDRETMMSTTKDAARSRGVSVRRVYGLAMAAENDAKRVLVDRVWPRGLRKDDLKLDLWLRELGPSTALRKWFGHRPERWTEFQRRYRSELAEPLQQQLIGQLADIAANHPLMLLYGARDEEHNQAIVVSEVVHEALERHSTNSARKTGPAA